MSVKIDLNLKEAFGQTALDYAICFNKSPGEGCQAANLWRRGVGQSGQYPLDGITLSYLPRYVSNCFVIVGIWKLSLAYQTTKVRGLYSMHII